MTSPPIHRVTTLDLAVRPWAWPFAQARRAEIDAHFAEKQREKPALLNGRVLLGRSPVFSGERFSASYFETDFASFLAWRDWGFPRQGTCSTALAWVRCAATTAPSCSARWASTPRMPAASIFPSGTPDLDDVRGEARSISRAASRARSRRRPGCVPNDYRSGCALGLRRIPVTAVAMMQAAACRYARARRLRARIEANLARQHQPELRKRSIWCAAPRISPRRCRGSSRHSSKPISRPNPDVHCRA